MFQMHPSAVLAMNEEGDSSSVVITFGFLGMDRSALLRRLETEEDSSSKFLCYRYLSNGIALS